MAQRNLMLFSRRPDIGSQSNLSPQDGANLWNQYICPLQSQGYKLFSPSPAVGPAWLQSFQPLISCQVRLLLFFLGALAPVAIQRTLMERHS